MKLVVLSLFFAAASIGAINAEGPPAGEQRSKPSSGKFRVCIDPGHPSENNDGGEVTNGLREVTINWEMGSLLARELKEQGFDVVLTKTAEAQFVTNKDRAAVANAAHASLLLRLHADAGAGKASGFTVYYPRKKGRSHGVEGPSADVLRSSAVAAKLFHSAFATALRGHLKDNGLHGDEDSFIGSKQGALTGSIFSEVPTVLVEMAFLTNARDAEWITQERNKIVMAKALAAGVRAVSEGREKQP